MTMELSMTIALLSALAIGEFFTALVITGFVLAAEVLEGLTVGRGRRAIQSLLDFLPRTVAVRRGGQVIEVPSDQIQVGETVIVKPGGHTPVDGVVLGGRSFVEQAAITGEAMPVEKAPGDAVYAGTINQSGALEIGAQKLGRDTTFGRIIEAVERAEKSRAPIQKTADRLAGYLVYFALGAAVLTFIITHNVRSTHLGCNRCRSVRHCGGNAACDSRSNRSRLMSKGFTKSRLEPPTSKPFSMKTKPSGSSIQPTMHLA
jgi:cation transport ATPase